MEDKLISSQWLINDLLNKSFYPAIVKSSIESAPSVDTVPVARCRECIGRSTWYNDAEYGCAICGMSGMYPKSENGYCSYGLRRSDEE